MTCPQEAIDTHDYDHKERHADEHRQDNGHTRRSHHLISTFFLLYNKKNPFLLHKKVYFLCCIILLISCAFPQRRGTSVSN